MDIAVGETEYRWLEAAKSYENKLHSTTHGNALAAEYWERIGFCYNQASRKTNNLTEFKKLRQLSVDAYRNAAELFEKESNLGSSALCKALGEFTLSWIAPNLSEKVKMLDMSLKMGKKALKAFKKKGDEKNYVKCCNHLMLCLFEFRSIVPTQMEKQTIAQEAISLGYEALSVLSKLEDKCELILANSLISLHSWYASNINEREEDRKKLANESLKHSKKAIEVSKEIANPYYIAMSRWAAALSTLYLSKEIESSLEYAKEMLQQGSTVDDNYIKGIALKLLAQTIDFIAMKEANPEKKREYYTKIIKYSKDSERYLQLVSQDYYIAETFLLYTESYISLGLEVEIELEKKHALLKKAIRIGKKGLEYAVKSGYPDALYPALHGLSKALYFYSKLAKGKNEKIKLLEEALTHRKEHIRFCESAYTFYSWGIGLGKIHAGLIEAELARLETDKDKKITLLVNAVSDIKDGISCCEKWIRFRPTQFGGSTMPAIAQYENVFGGLLNELYFLAKDKKYLIQAIEVYSSACERFKKVKLPNRVAESYWKIAMVQDILGEKQEASKNYELASKAYDVASKKIPQFKDFFIDYSLYMQAWSHIEQARYSHYIENYEEAKQHYEKAANFHESTSSWSYLTSDYFAWARMEEAEGYSRKENTHQAKQRFQEALQQFSLAEESMKQRLEQDTSPDEEKMVQRLLKASELRRNYCQVRILMEEAKLLEKEGKYLQSSKKYENAGNKISAIIEKMDLETEGKELEYIAILCKAWEKMANAEETSSSEAYLEAAELFQHAKEHCYTSKASFWALGNSNFCRGLAAGANYQINLDLGEYAKAKSFMKSASTHYEKAGFKAASEYAKATQRLFDAYAFMNQAENELDQEKRAKQYQMAENLLQIAAGSFMKAKQPEKTAQVQEILANVKEEKALAISLSQVMQAPTIASSTLSFTAPALTSESSVGLEKFEHANVQANLVSSVKQVKIGESFCLSVEFVNAGREPALLTRVEDFVPQDFVVVKTPEIYRLEDACLNMKGKQIGPLKLIEAKLVLQPSKKGLYQLKPTVHYLDEFGQDRSLQLKSVEIRVEEVVLADRVSTGTRELDSLLLGGIPKEYAVALTGSPSDERELIIRNFLEAGTKEGQTSFYVSTEPISIETLLDKASFYLFLCNPKPKVEVPDLPNVYKLLGKTDLTNLNIALLKAYRKVEQSPTKRFCLDIVSDILLRYGAEATRRWVSELITDMVSKGFTILAVMDPAMHPFDQATAVLNLFDGEISLYRTEDPMEYKKSLRIKKLRNQDYIKNPICLANRTAQRKT